MLALFTVFKEGSTGLEHITAFGWQPSNFERFLHVSGNVVQSYLTKNVEESAHTVVFLFLGLLGLSLFSAALFWNEGSSGPAIGLAGVYLVICATNLEPIFRHMEAIDTSKHSLATTEAFVKETPQENRGGIYELPEDWPAQGRVEFRNVSASYGPNMPLVLHDISLSIQSKDKVCVFGRTGSGKTSLLLALLGFLEYTGKIEIDGIDISCVPPDVLRSRIVTISQEQMQLDGSIRDNLLPYETPSDGTLSDEDRRAAAEDLDAMATDLLTDLGVWGNIANAGGLDAQMEDAGFSKGMLQMVCFARAVLRYHHTNGKLVVVDEATSSMDLWQDEAVQTAMWEFFEGCTILQVAHLEESIKDAELSVELSKGQIVHKRRGPTIPPGVETLRGRAPISPVSVAESLDHAATPPSRRITTLAPSEMLPNPGWMPPGNWITEPVQEGMSSSYLTTSRNSTSSSYIGSSSNHTRARPYNDVTPRQTCVVPSIEGNGFGPPGANDMNLARTSGISQRAQYWQPNSFMQHSGGYDSGTTGSSAMSSIGSGWAEEELASIESDHTSRPDNPVASHNRTFMFH